MDSVFLPSEPDIVLLRSCDLLSKGLSKETEPRMELDDGELFFEKSELLAKLMALSSSSNVSAGGFNLFIRENF
jgi:hypothetical protein